MADLLIYYKTHWYDLATPERQAEVNVDRCFDSRYVLGDIVEIAESPKFQNSENPAFRVIEITNRTKSQIIDYMADWKRSFAAVRTLNDIDNERYEYEISINVTSTSGRELFQPLKEIINKKEWIDIISTSSTMIKIGVNGTEERRNLFQNNAKAYLRTLSKIIAKRRYRFDVDNFPNGVLNKFGSADPANWVVHYTAAQVVPYLIDKENT